MTKPQPFSLVSFVVLACVACGSDFKAGGSAGASGDGSDGGAAQAGAPPTAGDTSSGATAGDVSAAGDSSTGGAAHGGAGHGGAPSGGAGHGGASSGGAPSGGASEAGGTGGSDCTALKTEYAALVKKARVCDQDSTDECTTDSTAPAVGCGCPTLLNVKSESTPLALDKYKELQKANCNNGPICNIACLPVTSASCAQSTGAGSPEFVCTGVSGGVAN